MSQSNLGNIERRARGSETASLELFVSIYLLLLAFFIVLNNISNQKVSKAGAVMDSVNSSFDKEFAPPARVVDLLRKPEAIAPNDEFIEEAAGELDSVFSLQGGFSTEGGDTIQVDIPLKTLFQGSSPVPREDLSDFIGDLVTLVEAVKPGERREVEFIFGSGADKLSSQPVQKQFLAARRAGALALALEAVGLPSNAIGTGVAAGPTDVITVRFRILADDQAAVTFSDVAGAGTAGRRQ